MTKIHESIVRNADSIVHLLEIIKKLEERIIILEREGLASSRPRIAPLPSDNYYWEHG